MVYVADPILETVWARCRSNMKVFIAGLSVHDLKMLLFALVSKMSCKFFSSCSVRHVIHYSQLFPDFIVLHVSIVRLVVGNLYQLLCE